MNPTGLVRASWLAAAMASTALLTACAASGGPAPVLDRTSRAGLARGVAPQEPPPPGYHRVRRGETLYRIALDQGQSPRDLVIWNNLANPNQIEADQLIRVVPPAASPDTQARAAAIATPVRPEVAVAQPIEPVSPGALSAAGGEIALTWPARGPLIGRFEEKNSKGIDIGGNRGDPIVAAEGGRVIHVGPLRGYGNLVIIKHNSTFLTAYGNNDKVLVTEQSMVKKGQRIAEMGSTDADRVKLHFEVRRNGKPVDPMRFLPSQ